MAENVQAKDIKNWTREKKSATKQPHEPRSGKSTQARDVQTWVQHYEKICWSCEGLSYLPLSSGASATIALSVWSIVAVAWLNISAATFRKSL